jgi:hypothetical protein
LNRTLDVVAVLERLDRVVDRRAVRRRVAAGLGRPLVRLLRLAGVAPEPVRHAPRALAVGDEIGDAYGVVRELHGQVLVAGIGKIAADWLVRTW